MSLKLNDEQRKLVEQNHNLIYSAMRKCGIRRQDFDDYYGFAAIGLCKAAIDYDETRSKSFSTYAYLCIQNEITVYNKYRFRQKRKGDMNTISYNHMLDDWDEYKNENSFLLKDEENFEKNIIFKLNFQDKCYTLNNKDRMIVDLKSKGYTYQEIAKMFGTSFQAIQQKIKRIRSTTFSRL